MADLETTDAGTDAGSSTYAMLVHIPMRVSVEIGSASLTLAELLALQQDGVIALDRPIDEPLDILVNGTLIARGEPVETDGRYGIRIAELVAPAGANRERRT